MYFKARYYDPAVGRFITADPTIPNPEKSQLFNRYMFVAGSPIQLMDTSGYSDDETSSGGGGYGSGVSSPSGGGGGVIKSGCALIAGAISKGANFVSGAVGAVKDVYNGTKDWISAGVTKSGNSLSNRISAAQIRREVGVERGTPALKVTSVVTGNINDTHNGIQRSGMGGYEDMEYVDENGIYSKTRIDGVKWLGAVVTGEPYEQPTNEGKGSTKWNEDTNHKINVVWGAGYESNENLVRIHTGSRSEGCFVFGNSNNELATSMYDSIKGNTEKNISVGLLHTVIDSRSLSEIANKPITQNKFGF